MPFATIGASTIEYEWILTRGAAEPAIVLLHEGLGSVSMWRTFPDRLNEITGRAVLAYSREGYGRSSPLKEPRAISYMHTEALTCLPALLDALDVRDPILLGHSDGASIALIHAAASGRPVSGLLLLAPHVIVEDITIQNILAAKRSYESGKLRAHLARYHENVDSAFRGWNDIWLHPDFRQWTVEDLLPNITCPTLAVQGEGDGYGSMDQIERIARGVPNSQVLILSDCGHAPHRDQPKILLNAVHNFVAALDL